MEPRGLHVEPGRLRLLPGFDEYLLGFKNRSLMLDPELKLANIPGGNCVFQSTVVRAGRVIGTWKRTTTKTRTTVRVQPLTPLTPTDRTRVEAAFTPYAHFIGQPLRIDWPSSGRPLMSAIGNDTANMPIANTTMTTLMCSRRRCQSISGR